MFVSVSWLNIIGSVDASSMLDRSDWKEEKDQQGHAEVLTHRKRLQQAVLFGHGGLLVVGFRVLGL